MVHSLELIFDGDADAAVVDEVNVLAAAGLRNPHRDQRPHVTLIAARAIGAGALGALGTVAQRLPITVGLGAPLVFSGAGGFTLARSVVPSTDLLGIHAAVVRLSDEHVSGTFAHCRPGGWTPHVTLARRLSGEQVAEAVVVLRGGEGRSARVAGLRHWDGDAKTEAVLAGRAC